VRARLVALPLLTSLLLVALVITGCGRRATHADCQLIVDRSVELQMRGANETDPKAIAKREESVRAELDGEIITCERERRVTDNMMACVQSASTTAELEKCLK
jgi:hypothetical protein